MSVAEYILSGSLLVNLALLVIAVGGNQNLAAENRRLKSAVRILAATNHSLSTDLERAEAVERTWPFAPALVDVCEPIHDGVVLDFCRGDVGGDAS